MRKEFNEIFNKQARYVIGCEEGGECVVYFENGSSLRGIITKKKEKICIGKALLNGKDIHHYILWPEKRG